MKSLTADLPSPGHRQWLTRIDQGMKWLIEVPAAFAVLAEVLILLVGVVSRFAFHHPLVWSDELASLVFLWLAMLGSAAALRSGQHMRMTALIERLSPTGQARAAALAVAAPCLFLMFLVGPSMDYAQNQWFVESPGLGLPDAFRSAAVPFGCSLMILVALVKLAHHRISDIVFSIGVLAVVAAVLFFLKTPLQSMGNWNLAIFFGLLLGSGVLGGVPIAFCFGLATVSCLLLTTSTPLMVVSGRIDEGMSSLILLAIPLFILLGQLLIMTRMADALVTFLASLLGHVRGGMSYVLIGAMILVSGISGAKTADMAAVAPVLFPEMKRRGAHEGELVSLLAGCGAMAETIPPSLVLIIIGSVTGLSIAALFTGGLLPGLVLAVALALIARHRMGGRALTVERTPLKTVFHLLIVALPVLLLPLLIRAAVIEGVATATEVSTIGIAYAVVVGIVVYRRFDWRRIYPMLVEAAALSGAILFIIGAASAMAWALTQANFSHALAQAMSEVPGGKVGFILASVVVFVILGSVLEGIPAMVLFGPLLFPVARQMGVNEIHYAMVVILAMGLGLFAPPFGLGYYAACTIAKVDPNAGLRRIWPYLGALAVGLILVALVPWFSIGLLPKP
jgi:tripartite ATP-independent transporter DctM subunit